MNELLDDLLGLHASADSINTLQMSVRAVVVFSVALVLLRLAGKRTFGSNSPFNVVLKIILGSVLGRAIVAASPFVETLVASAVMVGLHRLLGIAAYRSHTVGKLIKGEAVVLAENGELNHQHMRQNDVTENDLREGVRNTANMDELSQAASIRLERDGEITVVKKSAN